MVGQTSLQDGPFSPKGSRSALNNRLSPLPFPRREPFGTTPVLQRKPRGCHEQLAREGNFSFDQDEFLKVLAKLCASQSLLAEATYELEVAVPRAASAWAPAPNPGTPATSRLDSGNVFGNERKPTMSATAFLQLNSTLPIADIANDDLPGQDVLNNNSSNVRFQQSPDSLAPNFDSKQMVENSEKASTPISDPTSPISRKSNLTELSSVSVASVARSISSFAKRALAVKRSPSFGKFKQQQPEEGVEGSEISVGRQWVASFLAHAGTQSISVSLILFTVVLICLDTDARAEGSNAAAWEEIAMTFCSLAYVLEFSAFVYLEQWRALRDKWFYVDSLVIAAGAIGYVASTLDDTKGLELIKLLRLFRLLRLGRLVRALRLMQNVKWLKEPYILSMMMGSCLRTLIWAFLLMFFIITLWSILAVELLNDVVQELALHLPDWQSCERCSRSFKSVWESNLTFFQTIVAGDSWGKVALPVIQEEWWSMFIFVGALSSVIFGVLNMIAAVVIDTFAERRSKDVSSIATELEYDELFERRRLATMFARIDEDQSGALSKEELHAGASKIREFRQYLRVLDIDDKDLSELFDMLDIDNSGEIDPEEFIDALYRMKSTESKTATRFVKHMVGNLFDRSKCMEDRLDVLQERLTRRLERVEKTFVRQVQAGQSEKIQSQDFLKKHMFELDKTVGGAIDKAVLVAFDAVLGTAAGRASQAIRQVIANTSEHAAVLADRARMLEQTQSTPRTWSRQTSRLSSVDERTPRTQPGRLVHLGETMMDVDPIIDGEPIVQDPVDDANAQEPNSAYSFAVSKPPGGELEHTRI